LISNQKQKNDNEQGTDTVLFYTKHGLHNPRHNVCYSG